MDANQGLICSLTSAKPNFQTTCETFNLDERMQAELIEDSEDTTVEIPATISPQKYQALLQEQNLSLAITGGILVGLVGAVLWAAITVATGWQIGYMALAIGAGVGFSMRYLGKGIEQVFGISGAAIAVFSCVIGNFLSVLAFIANAEGLTYMDTLLYFDYSYTLDLLAETAQFMDLVFYAIAGYEGYKFAFRQFSAREMASLK
ncbi:hypothetical protein Ataiwa_16960 [Algoriphagus taiwanensis]|uniref:Uncharacterized protein n=2 Tax=Algoriphagus taiwanensis TaxID=1445656 RepID=A0ABQ6PZQ1_9BACT|nr:hypothetical protein Ataiwa_16960 [Algoriphagus taiwanensis]